MTPHGSALHRGWRLPAALLLGALLLAGCRPQGSGTSGTSTGGTSSTQATVAARNNLDATPSKTAPTAVQVVTAKAGSLSAQRSVSATISSARDSNVAAQTSGTVSAVLFQEGDAVQAGQAVVQLDDTSLRQSLQAAQLSLQSAQINLAQGQRNTGLSGSPLRQAVLAAQSSLAKAQAINQANERLYALGGISQADLQASQASLAQAQSEYASAQNNLAQNGQSGSGSLALLQNQVASARNQVEQAQEALAKAQVRAPFAGVLGTIPAQVGASLASGATAFRLVDPAALQADFRVPPGDVGTLVAGASVQVTYAGQAALGHVKTANRVAGSDRLVPLSARLGAANIPVGAVAQVAYRVTLGGGVLLPTTAVLTDGDTTSVFVMQGGVATKTPVTILAESGNQVAVRGPESGQSVVSPIPAGLQDGASVQVSAAVKGDTP